MTIEHDLQVRSHVGRDLLQNAGLFSKDKLVIWEYVSNGLQYVDAGTHPRVVVRLDSRNNRATVQDNGRGMDWTDLQNFFLMHGENQDRKRGMAGRGYFGTGKSAAFGIADKLRVRSVKASKRSIVELHRKDIEAITSGDNIPIRTVEREVPTQEPNGTLIEIDEVRLRSFNTRDITQFIERHLARWSRAVQVYVNNHKCEFTEPPIAEEFRFKPDAEIVPYLGDVELVIKVATAPLDQDLRGISIFANGVWHETTLAGNDKEMSQYLFGEIDVPRLEDESAPVPAFDVSRSMRLNQENQTVRYVYGFISQKIEEVRSRLVEQERQRKEGEVSRKLSEQADEIAGIINDDFASFRNQLARARAKSSGGSDTFEPATSHLQPFDEGGELLPGSSVLAEIAAPDGNLGADGTGGGNGGDPRDLLPELSHNPSGDPIAQPATESGKKKRSGGGFSIEFRNHGPDSPRAQYVPSEKTIYINLDHPQMVNALRHRTVEDVVFKRLAYEIAFSEYAIALSSELASQNAYFDVFEPITEIRDTINRIAGRAAHLYSE